MTIIEKYKEIIDGLSDSLVVLELGACDGYHTRLLVEYLLNTERIFSYFAFEPDPRILESIKINMGDVFDEIRFFNIAIAANDGPVDFWLSSGRSAPENQPGQVYYGSSSIREPKLVRQEFPGIEFNDKITVDAFSLDTIVRTLRLDRIDFIWSDIQGAEGDMIAGGREALNRTRWLYTEADGNGLYEGDVNEGQIIELLPGWESFGRFDGDLLLRNTNF